MIDSFWKKKEPAIVESSDASIVVIKKTETLGFEIIPIL